MAEVEDQRAGGTPESRAELVSKLTHEIRGPVSTIRGLAGTTLTHYERLSDEERREFLRLIRHEAERLERAVEQVALALRLDARALRFDIRPQDLGAIVREAAEAAETGDHPLEVDAAELVEAPVDGTHVASIVRQLIDNAVRFSPPDAPITVRLRKDGKAAVIEVADRGPGIPPDTREIVFERFADWRPVDYEDRPGTGLGLFIVRALAREQGGEASIADGPAGGTMLLVRLPMEG
ncbi:MAG TPA: ATP-binding protein [Actinomycetota bacterium]|nr:ATP-binding protein [Actinomycetota bacterium]